MTPLRDGVFGRGHDAKQRIEDGGLSGQLASARHHEAAGSVMEQGRVVDPQLCAKDRVVLVTGRADGVEAAVGLLQVASGDVDDAAGDLVLPHLDGLARREPGSGSQWSVGSQQRCRWSGRFEELVEGALDDGDAVGGHRAVAIIAAAR